MKIFLLTLLIGVSAISHGQNKLSGTILDGDNNPLPGVSVYAPELHKSTTTNAAGQYALSNLPSGTLNVVFAFVGFSTENKSVDIKQKENQLDFAMAPSMHQMDEVIVSTAFNKLQSQNVMKVTHENLESLRQKGVPTLIDGLATIPGVSQIATGASIGKPVIRGLSANRVLVYAQGVRLENQQFGDEHGLGLNDSGIESVEVIKGPASLLYGSDALGGVLYFNPEKFAEADTFKGDVQQRLFSNTRGSSSGLGLKTSTENWKFLARGNYTTHADYQLPSGNRVTNTRYAEKDLKTGIGYSNGSVSTVLRYNFNRMDLGIPEEGIAMQSTRRKTLLPRQAVDNHIVSWNNKFFMGRSVLDANIGYIRNDRSEFEDGAEATLHMRLETLNYDLKYRLPKWGRFEMIGGLQGMYQTNANLGSEFLIPDAETTDFAVFGTVNYEWKSSAWQAGIRYDNRKITDKANGEVGNESYFEAIDQSFDSFNAALGFKTDLAAHFTMRLNLASGFRAPNLAELTSNGVHEGTNRYEIGNPNLTTEQNVQADLNLDYDTEHLAFFANGFYNHINHYIYANPTDRTLADHDVYEYVQDNAQLYGGEAGIHFHPHPLDWLHFESSFESVTATKANGDYLPLIPANSWNNTLRAEFRLRDWLRNGYARLNVRTTFDQHNVDGFETPSNGYTLVNLGLGGQIRIGKTAFEVSLNGNNVCDKTYIAHLSRLKNDGIANMGRNLVLGVNFNL